MTDKVLQARLFVSLRNLRRGHAPGAIIADRTCKLLPILSLALLLLVACSGGGGGSSPVPAASPDFTLTAAQPDPMPANGNTTVTVTATRVGGHSAAITLGLQANVQGITGSGSIPAGAENGSLTIFVPSGVAAGSYGLTVSGSDGVLLTRTTGVTLTVTATATVGTVSRVEVRNNVPTLLLHDQAMAPTSLFAYNVEQTVAYDSAGWLAAFKGYVDKAKNTGVTYLAFELYLHAAMFATPSQPAVPGTDLDFAKLDALFDYAKQQGVYLLPTLWVSSPPEWWAAQHPDQLQLGSDQTAPPTAMMSVGVSYNNPDYWGVMDGYLTTIVDRYKDHPALLGWSPCVGMTRENNYGPSYLATPAQPPTAWGDYSPYAKRRFLAWLKEKYVTDGGLRAAWQDPAVTLAAVDMPLPQATVTTPPESVANGPGDTRPAMQDWLDFRISEKGQEWNHFLSLVKSLDPNHVLAINPAGGIFAPDSAVAHNGTADGLQWTRSPLVDMVLIHPRISTDETPGPNNTLSYQLFAFAASARRAGKVATFALEDNGEVDNGGKNVESYSRIDSLSALFATAGAGCGWVTEASGLLSWSDLELAEVKKNLVRFDPSQRVVTVPTLAILVDPQSAQREYPLGGRLDKSARSSDRISFYQALFAAGIMVDPLEVAAVIADPGVLNKYQGVIAADLGGLSVGAAQILNHYAQTGGGLFVAGRTGIFDGGGNLDYSAVQSLAGLADLPVNSTSAYPAWSFDTNADPILAGISGQTVDTANSYSIPSASWTGSGYTELAHAAGGTRPPMLLKKGKTVIWLPRLATTNGDLPLTLFKNWQAGLTQPSPNSIGFVGCSLSINAVNGYRAQGGSLLWPGGSTGYAGGGLSLWVSQLKGGSQPGSYWSKFSTMLSQYPNPQAIWWELCPNADAPSVTYDDTVLALNEIKRLAPGAKVYVTGVPIYPQDGSHCATNTDAGSQATMDLAAQLVANGAALEGPGLSPLTSAQVADGCHANAVGEGVWGNDLRSFFGQ